MLGSVQQVPHSRRYESSWSDFLDQVGAASLTLIGFESQDLSQIYDALEVCSKTRNLQAVEVFIQSMDDLSDDEPFVPPGLCLVHMPDDLQKRAYQTALHLLSDLAGDDSLTVIPVLKPCGSKRAVLNAIGRACPAYLNSTSELRDFVAMFNAFLFPDPSAGHAARRNFEQTESSLMVAN